MPDFGDPPPEEAEAAFLFVIYSLAVLCLASQVREANGPFVMARIRERAPRIALFMSTSIKPARASGACSTYDVTPLISFVRCGYSNQWIATQRYTGASCLKGIGRAHCRIVPYRIPEMVCRDKAGDRSRICKYAYEMATESQLMNAVKLLRM